MFLVGVFFYRFAFGIYILVFIYIQYIYIYSISIYSYLRYVELYTAKLDYNDVLGTK